MSRITRSALTLVIAFGLIAGMAIHSSMARNAAPQVTPLTGISAPITNSIGAGVIPRTGVQVTAPQKTFQVAKKRSKSARRFVKKRRRAHRRARRYNPGAWIAVGIIAALIAEGMAYDDIDYAMQRCAERYYSFDWRTGTYITYDGRERLCPYLR